MKQKTILLADDDIALVRAMALRCQQLGVNTQCASDGLQAYQYLIQSPPDLMVLDVSMPGADGLYMCSELAADERFSGIPKIVLTGKSDEATRSRCDELGAEYVWKGLDTWNVLREKICHILGISAFDSAPSNAAPEAAPEKDRGPCVLVIDDDVDILRSLSFRLRANGFDVLLASTAQEGVALAIQHQPNAIITDYRMPGGYGNHVIGRLREHTLTKDTPLFVLSGQRIDAHRDYALERELLSLGATRFFTKPPDLNEVVRELRAHCRV